MRRIIVALLACLLTACGGTAAVPDDTTGASAAPSVPAASPEATPLPLPNASSGGESGSAPEAVVALVSQFMEQQLNLPAANLTLENAEATEWPDGSLGCPEPGMVYTQAIVPGYKLTMSDGSKTYEVHTNEDGSNVVVCENGRPLKP